MPTVVVIDEPGGVMWSLAKEVGHNERMIGIPQRNFPDDEQLSDHSQSVALSIKLLLNAASGIEGGTLPLR